MRVALVHDYLTVLGGAERVVLSLAKAFPDAPVHTSLHRPGHLHDGFDELDVRPSPLNRVSFLRDHYRLALPLLAPVMQATKVDADVVVCNSSGWSHGVRTDGRKVVYCHNPARWLYQREVYLSLQRPSWWLAAHAFGPPLRRWDQQRARSADRYVASSSIVAARIGEVYGIEAEVIHPPSSFDPDGPVEPLDIEPGFALTVGRMLPYKNIGCVVEAFRAEPSRRLVVVGTGPDHRRLTDDAPRNVVFLGDVSDDRLRWLYRHAAFLVSASFEDFGLTPVEAASLGTSSVLLRAGGYAESMAEGTTTTYFDATDRDAIRAALSEHDRLRLDDAAIRAHAQRYTEQAFVDSFRSLVRSVL